MEDKGKGREENRVREGVKEWKRGKEVILL
jgi:hypothetical protein